MSQIELCACGHALDHYGKRCHHSAPLSISPDDRKLGIVADDGPCPCPSGIRVDVATLRVLSDATQFLDIQNKLMLEMVQTQARILAVMEHVGGVQSRIVDAGNGKGRVEVKPKIMLVGG